LSFDDGRVMSLRRCGGNDDEDDDEDDEDDEEKPSSTSPLQLLSHCHSRHK